LLAFRPTVFRISHIPTPLFSDGCELIKTEDFGFGEEVLNARAAIGGDGVKIG
jgi:hypothetical protein